MTSKNSLTEQELTERLAEIEASVNNSPIDYVAIMVEKDGDYQRIVDGLAALFGASNVDDTGKSPAFFPNCNRVLIYKK